MSSYQYSPSPATPSTPSRQTTPSTPATTPQRSTTSAPSVEQNFQTRGSESGFLKKSVTPANQLLGRRSYTPTQSVSSISKTFNTTEEQVKNQNKSFLPDTNLQLSTESMSFIKYVEGKGAKLSVFAEEIAYEKNFTNALGERGSYPQSQTARYHFVSMITPGYVAHGRQTPLTNEQILNAHPELTLEKISTMRQTYNQNSKTRPFLFPIEITNYVPNTSELNKLKALQRDVYSYAASESPLEFVRTGKFEGSPVLRGLPQDGTVSSTEGTPPRNAVAGDLWFDTVSGRLFAYVRINNNTQWLEV